MTLDKYKEFKEAIAAGTLEGDALKEAKRKVAEFEKNTAAAKAE